MWDAAEPNFPSYPDHRAPSTVLVISPAILDFCTVPNCAHPFVLRITIHEHDPAAVQDFGAKNSYGGNLYRGFIYFQAQPYTAIRVKITNVK